MALTIPHLLTIILIATVPLTTAIGCNGCLNQDIDSIRYDCLMDCAQAFNPRTQESDACVKACNDFIFDHKCCSSGDCAAEPETCLALLPKLDFSNDIDFLRARSENPEVASTVAATTSERRLIRDARRSALDRNAHAQAEVTAAKHELDETLYSPIEPRFNAFKICCTAVQRVLDAARPDIEPLFRGEYPKDAQIAGITLMAFGIAGSAACNFAFGFKCIYEAMTGQ